MSSYTITTPKGREIPCSLLQISFIISAVIAASSTMKYTRSSPLNEEEVLRTYIADIEIVDFYQRKLQKAGERMETVMNPLVDEVLKELRQEDQESTPKKNTSPLPADPNSN